MANLLIHSMSEFAHLILPALDLAGSRRIVEIGAEHAGMSKILERYCTHVGGRLVSIDPNPSPEFERWLDGVAGVEHIAARSLDVLTDLAAGDAWFIDGDHNWYTVYHELLAIDSVSRRDGKPMLAFMHDVDWPCARRDAYYAPQDIPAEFRHPHRFDAGVSVGEPELMTDRGFRGCGAFAWATIEGGPRNGVLTAIEDFMLRAQADGRRLGWAMLPAVFGLGVIYDLDAPWAGRLAAHLAPWHEHPLLARLEANRLANYLRVIDLQDGKADLPWTRAPADTSTTLR